MKCEHIAELLPDYLQGRLSAELHTTSKPTSNSARTVEKKWSFGENSRFCPSNSQVLPLARVLKPCCRPTKRVVRISLRTTRRGENALPPGAGMCSIGFAHLWGPQRGAPRCLLSAFTRVFRWLVPNPIPKTSKQCNPNSRA